MTEFKPGDKAEIRDDATDGDVEVVHGDAPRLDLATVEPTTPGDLVVDSYRQVWIRDEYEPDDGPWRLLGGAFPGGWGDIRQPAYLIVFPAPAGGAS